MLEAEGDALASGVEDSNNAFIMAGMSIDGLTTVWAKRPLNLRVLKVGAGRCVASEHTVLLEGSFLMLI